VSDTTEAATEVVAEVAEEVAEQATHIAEVSRGVSKQAFRFGFGGFVVGAGLSGGLTYFLLKRKLEKQYSEQAAEEVAEMAQHYRDKMTSLDGTAVKNSTTVEDIVREKGYAKPDPRPTQPPMAVVPPSAVVEAAEDKEQRDPAPPPAPVPVPETRNAFKEFGDDARDEAEWDYHKERSRRSPLRPYVIHIDERDEGHSYEGVMYTYFEEDDVLLNEREEIMDAGDRERVVGESNLERFGHGVDDPDCVYIRNDQLSMIIEITRTHGSYEQEMGFTPEPELRHSFQRRERMRFDDD
jgi:hypothetical protein